jgi:hypothetical protein
MSAVDDPAASRRPEKAALDARDQHRLFRVVWFGTSSTLIW